MKTSNVFPPAGAWSRRPRRALLASCLALGLSACGGGGDGPAPAPRTAAAPEQQSFLTTQLDGILAKEQSAGQPGVAILVVKDGATVYQRAKGMANLASATALDENTAFDVGSVAKPITATAIMQLSERKLLSLDDRASKWLPDLPSAWSAVTIRQLLSHQAGLPDYLTRISKTDVLALDGVDNAELLARLAAKPALAFAPGTGAEYSNTNYLVLGEIIARASGMGYARYLAEHIFAPLGMHSSYVLEAAPPGVRTALNFAQFSTTGGARLATTGGIGVRSTLLDMNRFLTGFIGGKLVSAESMRLMTSPQSGFAVGGVQQYGYGWFVRPSGQPMGVFAHSGEVDGFRSLMRANIERGVHYVILSNGGDASERVNAALLDVIQRLYE